MGPGPPAKPEFRAATVMVRSLPEPGPQGRTPFTFDSQFILSHGWNVSNKGSHPAASRKPPLVHSSRRLGIVFYPDPVLLRAAAPVTVFDDGLRTLAGRMLELMREAKGVGLAAPQVGEGIRLFVCNAVGEPGHDLAFVNPRFVELTGSDDHEEGCLSIPGVTVNVRRATSVVMEAFDLEGRPVRAEATDLPARIWQHEVDHLDGRLIIDRMSSSDEVANRRAIKQLRDDFNKRKA